MRRFHAGSLIDSFVSDPEYLGLDDDGSLAGDTERWQDLLAPGQTLADLRAVWDERLIFAQHTLGYAAEVLGLDPNLALTDVEGAVAGFPHLSEEAPRVAARLRFRLAELPAALQPMQGPPLLAQAGGSDLLDLRVGETMPPAGITVFSRGGPSTGLVVTLEGSAVEQQLLELTSVRIRYHQEGTEAWSTGTAVSAPLELVVTESKSLYRAVFATLPIAAGIADPMVLYTGQVGVNQRRAAQALQTAQLGITLDGAASVVGAGELILRVAPVANPTDGETIWTIRVRTRQPERVPRHAQNLPDLAQYARTLVEPSRLVALIALGPDRERSAAAAEAAIARWATVLEAGEQNLYEAMFQRETHLRPQQRRMSLPGHSDTVEWEELRAILRSGETFAGHLPYYPSPEGNDLFSRGTGFLFDATSLFFRLGGDILSPQLVLYLDHRPDQQARSVMAEVELRTIVDDVMRDAEGLQALIANWDWTGLLSAQSTPYELACGVNGQCTTGLRWCSRYLRGMADTLWLGSAVRSHLDDLERLRVVAQVDVIEQDVWRLRRRPEVSLDELEQALEPLLPDHAAWTSGVRELYRRR